MKEMSSSANTLVGSAIASASEFPIRRTGSTSYFFAIAAGTSFRTSRSISSCERVMDGTPYWRERKPISCSSLMNPSRIRMEPSFSVEPFCSTRAFWSCS